MALKPEPTAVAVQLPPVSVDFDALQKAHRDGKSHEEILAEIAPQPVEAEVAPVVADAEPKE